MAYDPLKGPDPKRWIWLNEEVRLSEVLAHHKRAKIKLPNAQLHAIMHVVVENQVAENFEPAVRALARLMGKGLDRHEAVHAIAWVFSQQVHDVIDERVPEFDRGAYAGCLEALTAEKWKREAG